MWSSYEYGSEALLWAAVLCGFKGAMMGWLLSQRLQASRFVEEDRTGADNAVTMLNRLCKFEHGHVHPSVPVLGNKQGVQSLAEGLSELLVWDFLRMRP